MDLTALRDKAVACSFVVALFFLGFWVALSGLFVWNATTRRSWLDCLGLWALRSFSCEVFSLPWSLILGSIHVASFCVSNMISDFHEVILGLSLLASAVPIGCVGFWRGVAFVVAYSFFKEEQEPLSTLLRTHQILFAPWPVAILVLAGNAILVFETTKRAREMKSDIETGIAPKT